MARQYRPPKRRATNGTPLPAPRAAEEALAEAEEAETTLTFATGMAAISAAFAITVRSGERVLAHRLLYGCTYSLRTLVESPDLMTHSALSEADKAKAGLGHGGIRLSIGCEEPHDILHDLSEALKKA